MEKPLKGEKLSPLKRNQRLRVKKGNEIDFSERLKLMKPKEYDYRTDEKILKFRFHFSLKLNLRNFFRGFLA